MFVAPDVNREGHFANKKIKCYLCRIMELKDISDKYNLITILGATASGKTGFAAQLAYLLDREIISADSRQVYRKMDIGTGKDLEDYNVNGITVKSHLIDIVEPGYKYNVYEYHRDFIKTFNSILDRNKKAVLCGGSGMYLEAVIKNYQLISVPHNDSLRDNLEKLSMNELVEILKSYKKLHNTTDITNKKRLVRAIEIADYYKNNNIETKALSNIKNITFGIKFDRNSRRKRISTRLKQRLDNGMIDEVKMLINDGVDKDTLIYYGLEYKFITQYLTGQLSYNEMFAKLETAIHQFSKRQMTWFRRMEKNGIKIHWLDGYMSTNEKFDRIKTIIKEAEDKS